MSQLEPIDLRSSAESQMSSPYHTRSSGEKRSSKPSSNGRTAQAAIVLSSEDDNIPSTRSKKERRQHRPTETPLRDQSGHVRTAPLAKMRISPRADDKGPRQMSVSDFRKLINPPPKKKKRTPIDTLENSRKPRRGEGTQNSGTMLNKTLPTESKTRGRDTLSENLSATDQHMSRSREGQSEKTPKAVNIEHNSKRPMRHPQNLLPKAYNFLSPKSFPRHSNDDITKSLEKAQRSSVDNSAKMNQKSRANPTKPSMERKNLVRPSTSKNCPGAQREEHIVDSARAFTFSNIEENPTTTTPRPQKSTSLSNRVKKAINTTEKSSQSQPFAHDTSLESLTQVLQEEIKSFDEDHDYVTRNLLREAREAPKMNESSQERAKFEDKESPFQDFLPIPPPSNKSHKRKLSIYSRSSRGSKSTTAIHEMTYKSVTEDIPPYQHFVPLKQNVLAESRHKLIAWPFFASDDCEIPSALMEDLQNTYTAGLPLEKRDEPKSYLDGSMRRERVKQYKHYLLRFLVRIECSIESFRDFVNSIKPFENELSLTERACKAIMSCLDLEREDLVKLLPESQTSQDESLMTYSALHCEICQMHDCPYHGEIREDMQHDGQIVNQRHVVNVYADNPEALPGTRLWRPSLYQENEVSLPSPKPGDKCSSQCYKSIQAPTSSYVDAWRDNYKRRKKSKLDSLGWSEVDTTLFKELLPDYRTEDGCLEIEGPCLLSAALMRPCLEVFFAIMFVKEIEIEDMRSIYDSSRQDPPRLSPSPKRPFQLSQFRQQVPHEEQSPFYPCFHSGPCDEAKCICFLNEIPCEKTCCCSDDCDRRFRGCSCSKKGLKCLENDKCICNKLDRECDIDLCGTCGSDLVINSRGSKPSNCGNMSIQKNIPKRTLLGNSEVAGFGLYMGERVRKGDYVGEYKGEIITSEEAQRRGCIYHYRPTQYLSNLNKEQEIDATFLAAKTRFINHQSRDANINLAIKSRWCNGSMRLAFFASRDIEPGEELFVNYRYEENEKRNFIEKVLPAGASGKTAVKAKIGEGQLKKEKKTRTKVTIKETKKVNKKKPNIQDHHEESEQEAEEEGDRSIPILSSSPFKPSSDPVEYLDSLDSGDSGYHDDSEGLEEIE